MKKRRPSQCLDLERALVVLVTAFLGLVATPARALADGAWKCRCDVAGHSPNVPLAAGLLVAGALAFAVSRGRRRRRAR
jgi:hypothetical protein